MAITQYEELVEGGHRRASGTMFVPLAFFVGLSCAALLCTSIGTPSMAAEPTEDVALRGMHGQRASAVPAFARARAPTGIMEHVSGASCPSNVLDMLPQLQISRAVKPMSFSKQRGLVTSNAAADDKGYCEEKPVVAVLGYTGGVGTCLIAAMEKIGVKPYALVRSSTMEIGGAAPVPVDYAKLGEILLAEAAKTGGQPVIADVTASSVPQDNYQGWLEKGISVCAANKGIFAGDEKMYEALVDAAAKEPAARLLHEATVGAGLPVISTLKDLRDSSHGIEEIEGVMSGSLAYVLGQVAGGKKTLSAAVKEAKDLGYTEPDPREDLSGMDVARKAVILSRVAGLKGIDLTKLNVESLVPESLRDCSVEDFMNGLPAFDADFAKRVADVEGKGQRLHYAGKVDAAGGTVLVGPLGVDADHPFNNAGLDNLVSIKTSFYPRPLVVQGAGAGGDVTATGVLADILKCCSKPSIALVQPR